MNDSLFLSRSFVEFGPFAAEEIRSFHQRGILKDSDYVRSESSDAWIHVNEWAEGGLIPQSVPAEPPAPKAEKEVIPTPPVQEAPAAKKAAPAKKAAAKKAKKSA